jgi:putative membrane protein
MAPGSRDELIKALSGEFNGLIEVLTNDEHTETGVRAHITYVPVHITEGALSSLKEGLKRLLEKPYSRGLRLVTLRLKLKLLNNVAYELEYLLKKSYLETTLLLVAYVFLVSPVLAKLLLTLPII